MMLKLKNPKGKTMSENTSVRKLGTLRLSAKHDYTVRCDAIAHYKIDDRNSVMAMSIIGSATGCKAVTAALQAGKSTSAILRLEGAAPAIQTYETLRGFLGGYTIKKVALKNSSMTSYHVAAVAKHDRLIVDLTESALWSTLRSESFTTPILRSWIPWIMQEMLKRDCHGSTNVMLEKLRCFQMNCAVVNATSDDLDQLVSDGVQSGELEIGPKRKIKGSDSATTIHDCQTLEQYFDRYGVLLGQQAQKTLNPLHVPGRDAPLDFSDTLRAPYVAQAHCVTAAVKAFHSHVPSILFTAAVGTGKTTLASLTAHKHAQSVSNANYRAIVMCPPHLVDKWEEEIRETLSGIDVFHITGYQQVMKLWESRHIEPARPSWYIISRERAKMGAKWESAYTLREYEEIPRCLFCGEKVLDKDDVPVSPDVLEKSRCYCSHCDSPLWTYVRETGRLDHWEPARLIHKKLRGFFDYAIFDEIHELSKTATQQSNALGSIAAASKYCIGCTGTVLNGYAESLRPIMFRLSPESLVAEGFRWGSPMPFTEIYGRIETRITETENNEHTASGRGRKKGVNKISKPGVMPTLFGRHLIRNCIFLSLEEMADNLPPLTERTIPVEMDDELAEAYAEIEERLREELKSMLVRGDKRLLGKFLETLLYYPDHPWGWGEIGYHSGYGDERHFVKVCDAPDLSQDVIRFKEDAIMREIANEANQGRQCWVYIQRNGEERDYLKYLSELIETELSGLRVKILRSGSPSTRMRSSWINKHGPEADVILSHPGLVETGLDLFSKTGKHNFCTLMFAQLGYRLTTMRQAGGRAYRLMQTLPCRTMYFYYKGTMQDRALSLMGQKLSAALAIEGKFSSEGLMAMVGSDEGMEMMLAKSLVGNFKGEVGADRAWSKVQSMQLGGTMNGHRRMRPRCGHFIPYTDCDGVSVGIPDRMPSPRVLQSRLF